MKPASYFDILTKEATSGFASLAPASRFYLLLSCLFAQIEKNAFPQLLRSSTSVLVGMKKRGTRHSAKQLCLSPFDSSDNSKHQLIVKCPQQVKPPNFKIVPWSFKRLVQSRNWFFYRSLYMHDYHYPSLELNFEEGMDEVWGGSGWDAITRPSCVCGEMDIAPFFLSLSLAPPLDVCPSGSAQLIFPGVVQSQRFFSQDRGLSLFSHHHYARPPLY